MTDVVRDPFQGKSIPRTMLQYAIPTVLSQMITLLYNLADTFFVGHTNDPAQVAALTLSFPLFMTMTMIGNLFGIGANSLIARSLGSQKPENARKASTFAFYGALAVMAVWICVLAGFMPKILTVIGAVTEASYRATRAYLTWTVLVGGLPTMASLLIAHCIRGEGNTKQASIGVAIGGILNILLDPLFVQVGGMGAAGAGLATCISNCVSLIYLLVIMFRTKDSVVSLNPKHLKFESRIMKEVILVGIPAAIIVLLGITSNVILTHLMAPYGDVSVAAFGVVQKMATVCMQITIGLTQGIMPLLGFAYGAGDLKRVKVISRWASVIVAVYVCIMVIMSELFPKYIMLFFINEPETIATGARFMRIWILCVFGMCYVFLLNSIFQAMGKWKESLALSIIRQAVLLIPALLIMNRLFGSTGLISAEAITDTLSLIIGFLFYKHLMPKEGKGGLYD